MRSLKSKLEEQEVPQEVLEFLRRLPWSEDEEAEGPAEVLKELQRFRLLLKLPRRK